VFAALVCAGVLPACTAAPSSSSSSSTSSAPSITSPAAVAATVPSSGGIGDGIWPVGAKGIAPGTYQAAAEVPATCYWWIYQSGSAPDQILDHLIAIGVPAGGCPTVELAPGQNFQVWGCGIWHRLP
jgi:hypothetical protein